MPVAANKLAAATRLMSKVRGQIAEHEEEARAAAREGYRAHYCIHGVNLWVEYDPMCGYCESPDDDPFYLARFEPVAFRRWALDEAERRIATAMEHAVDGHAAIAKLHEIGVIDRVEVDELTDRLVNACMAEVA